MQAPKTPKPQEYFCKGQKRTLIFDFYGYSIDDKICKNEFYKFKLQIPDLTFIYNTPSHSQVYLTNNINLPVPFFNVCSLSGNICFHNVSRNAKDTASLFFNTQFSPSLTKNGLRYYANNLDEKYNLKDYIKFLKAWENNDNYLKQFGIN
jgi:hypothetical protein